MADNVVAMPGISAPDRTAGEQPQDHVVELLEDLLSEARSGKIQTIAIALVRPGEFVSHAWTSGGPHAHSLYAAIGDLSFAYSRKREEWRLSGAIP